MIKALLAWFKKLTLTVLARIWEAGHPTNESGNNMSQR